uniref:Mucin-like protein n=1 Tax=Plectus sambesii TaxID=2011161 RepID=A0A914V6A6_9BILA
MAGRFSSLLCVALCFYVASELNVEVASQTTGSITVQTETDSTAPETTGNFTGTTDSSTASASTASSEPQPELVLNLQLRFEMDFNESYVDNSSAAYQAMYTGFDETFSTAIYEDNVLSVTIVNVTNGSVIVDLRLNLKEFVNETDLRSQLDGYILSCTTNMTATNSSSCFFDFGPPPNITDFVIEDRRCDTTFCRNGTECEIDSNSEPQCVCPVGYNMTSSNDTSGDFQCEPVPMACYLSEKNVCLRNLTDNSTTCDPCHGSPIVCNETLGQICVKNAACAPECGCPPDKMMVDGVCLDACTALTPCQNGGNCSADGVSFNYTCNCSSEYSGTNCSKDVDECASTDRPPKCPMDYYYCENTQPGYNCGCQSGFVLNETGNECLKVNQIFNTTITLDYEYRASFKNKSSEAYKALLNAFTQAFQEIYINSSILSIDITNIMEGSIIVELTLNFKDYVANRSAALQQYTETICANGSTCFGLGPFIKKSDGNDMDTRCEGVLCPANTKCQTNDGDQLSCVCDGAGFKEIGDIGGAPYGPVTRLELCEDINECAGLNNCTTNEKCVNTIGSYQCDCPFIVVDGACQPPCSSNPCGSGDECEQIDNRSYRCNCPWTHTGQNCESALPLIFMILLCIFIVLFLVATGVAIFCFTQAQKDKLTVTDFQPLVGRTAAWRSTEL